MFVCLFFFLGGVITLGETREILLIFYQVALNFQLTSWIYNCSRNERIDSLFSCYYDVDYKAVSAETNLTQKVKVAESYPTFGDTMDCGLPGSSFVHGILQARRLEWVALPFSRWIFPIQGSNPGIPHCRWILGSPSLPQWIFPTQEWNMGLLNCKQILYQLSYQGTLF